MGLVWRVLTSLALLWIAACDATAHQTLDRWTLEVEGQTPVDVTLPARLDEHLPRTPVRYHLRTELNVTESEKGHRLSLVVPRLPARAELYVDGRQAVVEHAAVIEGYRHTGPHVWRLPMASISDGHATLDLVVEHRWTQSGWIASEPRLRRSGQVDPQELAMTLVNEIGAAAGFAGLVIVGMMALLVFLANRRLKVYRWFAIQMMAASYYPLYTAGYTQIGLGAYDTVLLSLCVDVALVASIYFAQEQFKLRHPVRPWWIALTVATLVTIAFSNPFWSTQIASPITTTLLAVSIMYHLTVGLRLTQRPVRPRGSVIFLAAWAILGITAILDGIAWLGLGDPLGGLRVACLGLGSFAVLASVLLTRDYIHALRRTENLNEQLAGRVRLLEDRQQEIQRLNDELREQIGHRSKQLFATLSLIGQRSDTAPRLKHGHVIKRRYRVVRELGAGGMGVVYEVIRIVDQRRLALKVATTLDARGLARLAREAELATRVAHPNIVTILDVDVEPTGFLYLVMEFVDGRSLRHHKDRYGDLGWAMPILLQIAEGLVALHREGIVHRDLKPANILLLNTTGKEGRSVKITDFGISRSLDPRRQPRGSLAPDDSQVEMPIMGRLLDVETRELMSSSHGDSLERSSTLRPKQARSTKTSSSSDSWSSAGPPSAGDSIEQSEEATRELSGEDPLMAVDPRNSLTSSVTQSGFIVGTPLYMAPELALMPPMVTPAADLFSFGVLAHQMLVGRRPFEEPLALMITEGRPIPPEGAQINAPELDPELRELVAACLSIDPNSRPPASHLLERLRMLQDPRDAPKPREHEQSSPPPPTQLEGLLG